MQLRGRVLWIYDLVTVLVHGRRWPNRKLLYVSEFGNNGVGERKSEKVGLGIRPQIPKGQDRERVWLGRGSRPQPSLTYQGHGGQPGRKHERRRNENDD